MTGNGSTVLDGTAVREVATLAHQAAAVQLSSEGSRRYADRALFEINTDPRVPAPLEFVRLKGFCDYLKAEPATVGALVHVAGPSLVLAYAPLEGADRHVRRIHARAVFAANKYDFQFNNFTSVESAIIGLQTTCAPETGRGNERDALVAFCGRVRATEEVKVTDDGSAQEVAAKRGVSVVDGVTVKNPWGLAPYRTFPEVEQPVSPFVVRFRGGKGELPTIGLFQTGDDRWHLEAVASIVEYLTGQLPGNQILG